MNSEEADTELILHAVDATVCSATSIDICSPDTDVLILAIHRYPELCRNTNFVTGTGKNRRTIQLKFIYNILGPEKAAALPTLQALSGSDNTGGFAGKGKDIFWKAFQAARCSSLTAMALLGTTTELSDSTCTAIEEFICNVYAPQTSITKADKLRWWLFKKKQAESEQLPPSPAVLQQAVLRSLYQVIVWNNDKVLFPEIPMSSGRLASTCVRRFETRLISPNTRVH